MASRSTSSHFMKVKSFHVTSVTTEQQGKIASRDTSNQFMKIRLDEVVEYLWETFTL